MPLNLGSAIRIGLSPTAVGMTLLDWRGRCRRSGRFAVEGEAPGWKGANATLRTQFKSGEWKAGAAQIVLSGHFVRHCLLPAERGLSKPAEQVTYVRHIFRGEYGDAVEGWRIVTDGAGNGTRLACAIDAALFDDLVSACREGGTRLRSLQPHLVVAANIGRALIGLPEAWLAVVENNLCVLGLLEAGRWRHIARVRLGELSSAPLLNAVHEQEILLDRKLATRNLYLSGVPREIADNLGAAGWNVALLPSNDAQPLVREAA